MRRVVGTAVTFLRRWQGKSVEMAKFIHQNGAAWYLLSIAFTAEGQKKFGTHLNPTHTYI
jgi:hypothetical protein